MKATGIVRRLDELGRVVIPIELRRTLEMEDRQEIEIYVEDDAIILKKFEKACLFWIVKRMLWRFTAKACAENA